MSEKQSEHKFELPELHSQFAGHIASFIRLKRGEGLKYDTEARLMVRFDAFCLEKHSNEQFDRQLVEDWTARKSYERLRTQTS